MRGPIAFWLLLVIGLGGVAFAASASLQGEPTRIADGTKGTLLEAGDGECVSVALQWPPRIPRLPRRAPIQEFCQPSFCDGPGVRCVNTGNCPLNGRCKYIGQADASCTGFDPLPPNFCYCQS